jgi:hypothetical protein
MSWIEIKALTVWGNVNNGLNVLSSEDQSTSDDRVVGFAEDTDGTEQVLSGCLETVEEATDLHISVRPHALIKG